MYRGWHGAVGDYAEITIQLRSLTGHLSYAQMLIKKAPNAGLSSEDRSKWEQCVTGCTPVVEQLNQIITKYKGLQSGAQSRKKNWDRLRLGNKDLNDLNRRLVQRSLEMSRLLELMSLAILQRMEPQLQEVLGLVRELPEIKQTLAEVLDTSNALKVKGSKPNAKSSAPKNDSKRVSKKENSRASQSEKPRSKQSPRGTAGKNSTHEQPDKTKQYPYPKGKPANVKKEVSAKDTKPVEGVKMDESRPDNSAGGDAHKESRTKEKSVDEASAKATSEPVKTSKKRQKSEEDPDGKPKVIKDVSKTITKAGSTSPQNNKKSMLNGKQDQSTTKPTGKKHVKKPTKRPTKKPVQIANKKTKEVVQ